MTGPIRVVQWATGGVGRAATEAVLKHPELELVGCWVHSPDKHGKDVVTQTWSASYEVAAMATRTYDGVRDVIRSGCHGDQNV